MLAWRAGGRGPLILGAGESVTVNDMVDDGARKVTGAPIPVEHIPAKPGEMPAVVVDISAARALGYRPALRPEVRASNGVAGVRSRAGEGEGAQ